MRRCSSRDRWPGQTCLWTLNGIHSGLTSGFLVLVDSEAAGQFKSRTICAWPVAWVAGTFDLRTDCQASAYGPWVLGCGVDGDDSRGSIVGRAVKGACPCHRQNFEPTTRRLRHGLSKSSESGLHENGVGRAGRQDLTFRSRHVRQQSARTGAARRRLGGGEAEGEADAFELALAGARSGSPSASRAAGGSMYGEGECETPT